MADFALPILCYDDGEEEPSVSLTDCSSDAHNEAREPACDGLNTCDGPANVIQKSLGANGAAETASSLSPTEIDALQEVSDVQSQSSGPVLASSRDVEASSKPLDKSASPATDYPTSPGGESGIVGLVHHGSSPASAGTSCPGPSKSVLSSTGRASRTSAPAAPASQAEDSDPDELDDSELDFETRRRRAVFTAMLLLLEHGARDPEHLSHLVAPMSGEELQHVAEERALAGRCGNPLCNSIHSIAQPPPRRRWDPMNGFVEPPPPSHFCSAACELLVESYARQLGDPVQRLSPGVRQMLGASHAPRRPGLEDVAAQGGGVATMMAAVRERDPREAAAEAVAGGQALDRLAAEAETSGRSAGAVEGYVPGSARARQQPKEAAAQRRADGSCRSGTGPNEDGTGSMTKSAGSAGWSLGAGASGAQAAVRTAEGEGGPSAGAPRRPPSALKPSLRKNAATNVAGEMSKEASAASRAGTPAAPGREPKRVTFGPQIEYQLPPSTSSRKSSRAATRGSSACATPTEQPVLVFDVDREDAAGPAGDGAGQPQQQRGPAAGPVGTLRVTSASDVVRAVTDDVAEAEGAAGLGVGLTDEELAASMRETGNPGVFAPRALRMWFPPSAGGLGVTKRAGSGAAQRRQQQQQRQQQTAATKAAAGGGPSSAACTQQVTAAEVTAAHEQAGIAGRQATVDGSGRCGSDPADVVDGLLSQGDAQSVTVSTPLSDAAKTGPTDNGDAAKAPQADAAAVSGASPPAGDAGSDSPAHGTAATVAPIEQQPPCPSASGPDGPSTSGTTATTASSTAAGPSGGSRPSGLRRFMPKAPPRRTVVFVDQVGALLGSQPATASSQGGGKAAGQVAKRGLPEGRDAQAQVQRDGMQARPASEHGLPGREVGGSGAARDTSPSPHGRQAVVDVEGASDESALPLPGRTGSEGENPADAVEASTASLSSAPSVSASGAIGEQPVERATGAPEASAAGPKGEGASDEVASGVRPLSPGTATPGGPAGYGASPSNTAAAEAADGRAPDTSSSSPAASSRQSLEEARGPARAPAPKHLSNGAPTEAASASEVSDASGSAAAAATNPAVAVAATGTDPWAPWAEPPPGAAAGPPKVHVVHVRSAKRPPGGGVAIPPENQPRFSEEEDDEEEEGEDEEQFVHDDRDADEVADDLYAGTLRGADEEEGEEEEEGEGVQCAASGKRPEGCSAASASARAGGDRGGGADRRRDQSATTNGRGAVGKGSKGSWWKQSRQEQLLQGTSASPGQGGDPPPRPSTSTAAAFSSPWAATEATPMPDIGGGASGTTDAVTSQADSDVQECHSGGKQADTAAAATAAAAAVVPERTDGAASCVACAGEDDIAAGVPPLEPWMLRDDLDSDSEADGGSDRDGAASDASSADDYNFKSMLPYFHRATQHYHMVLSPYNQVQLALVGWVNSRTVAFVVGVGLGPMQDPGPALDDSAYAEEGADGVPDRTVLQARGVLMQLLAAPVRDACAALAVRVPQSDVDRKLTALVSTFRLAGPVPGLKPAQWHLLVLALLTALAQHHMPALRASLYAPAPGSGDTGEAAAAGAGEVMALRAGGGGLQRGGAHPRLLAFLERIGFDVHYLVSLVDLLSSPEF